jgi:hypothetical protein
MISSPLGFRGLTLGRSRALLRVGSMPLLGQCTSGAIPIHTLLVYSPLMSENPSHKGSPGIPVVTRQISLPRRAKPLEIFGRPLNDVLFSREFRESPHKPDILHDAQRVGRSHNALLGAEVCSAIIVLGAI